MTQTDNPPTHDHALSPLARLAWLFLIVATLYVCYFHNLGAIGLVGPDEPRYAWIARAMAETGDWVTPRLYGNPWFEKPVLYYWGAALSFKLFGVSDVTARLPSAICALLATLAMAWLAWRLYGAETARWLLLLLPSTVAMIGFSHAAATDMPFAAMLTIAMICAAAVVGLARDANRPILPLTSRLALLLLGFFLGLAVLAKGPAALILAGGSVLLWAILTKCWRDAFRCLHPIAIASFCLIALPWYVLCARRNPDFFRVFIVKHNFKRYLTPEFQHIQPFWFYVPILLIAFAPWTLLLLVTGISGSLRLWRKHQASAHSIFLLSWAAFCPLFFSTSKSKLPGYILPAVPAIALLLVRSYVAFSDSTRRLFRQQVFGWATVTIPASLVLFWIGRLAGGSPTKRAMVVIGCVLLLFSLANVFLALRRPSPNASFDPAILSVLPVLLIVLMFQAFASPWLRSDPSGRTLAAEIQEARIPPNQVYAANIQRGQQFSVSFYLHQEMKDWPADSQKSGFLLLRSKSCGQYVKAPLTCVGEPIFLRRSGLFLYKVAM